MIKLIDILIESMADGKAFQAFVDYAVAKKEINANEGLNFVKKFTPKYKDGKPIRIGDRISVKIHGKEYITKVYNLENGFVTIFHPNYGYLMLNPNKITYVGNDKK